MRILISFFSFDARDSVVDTASRWSDPSTLHDRGKFDPNGEPAMLAIEKVKNSDTGVYRCRVDFQKNPTRNSKVNLTVISEYVNVRLLPIYLYPCILIAVNELVFKYGFKTSKTYKLILFRNITHLNIG